MSNPVSVLMTARVVDSGSDVWFWIAVLKARKGWCVKRREGEETEDHVEVIWMVFGS